MHCVRLKKGEQKTAPFSLFAPFVCEKLFMKFMRPFFLLIAKYSWGQSNNFHCWYFISSYDHLYFLLFSVVFCSPAFLSLKTIIQYWRDPSWLKDSGDEEWTARKNENIYIFIQKKTSSIYYFLYLLFPLPFHVVHTYVLLSYFVTLESYNLNKWKWHSFFFGFWFWWENTIGGGVSPFNFHTFTSQSNTITESVKNKKK